MAEINDLNVVDASNIARWPEGMAPSAVNNAGRADEGLLARWHKDTNGSVVSTGSANAYVVAANQTLSAYYDGLVIGFDANFANTGAATLDVDSVGAATIKKHYNLDLASGDIETGQKVVVVYDGTNWQLISPTARSQLPVFNVKDPAYGALGNDTGNDAQAFRDARDAASAAGGGIVYVPTGTYRVSGLQIAYADNVQYVGEGRSSIIKATDSNGVFGNASPTEATRTAFDADQNKYSITITLPTGEGTNFSAGDWFGLESSDTGFDTDRASEEHKIMDVTGDTLTLDSPLIFDYTTANSAEFWNASTHANKNIAIKNLSFTTSDSSTISVRTLTCRRIHGLRLENIWIYDAGGGIDILDCHEVQVLNVHVDNLYHLSTSFGYGINVYGQSSSVEITNYFARDTRHAFTTLSASRGGFEYGGPRNVTLTNCHGTNSNLTRESTQALAIWDTHDHGRNIKFIGCTAIQGASGAAIQIRAEDVSFVDAYAEGGFRNLDIRDTSKRAHIIGGKFVNSVTTVQAAINIVSGAEDVVVDGARVFEAGDRGINNAADGAVIKNCIVSNSVDDAYRDQATTGGIFQNNIAIFGSDTTSGIAFSGIDRIASGNIAIGYTNFSAIYEAADDDAVHDGNIVDGVPISTEGVLAVTSTFNVDGAAFRGVMITNEGAGGGVQINLPPAIKNNRLKFSRVASQQLEINPDGTEAFRNQTAGHELQLLTDDTMAEIWCVEDGIWEWRVYQGNAFGVLTTDYQFAA